jgi:hypothetical protein
MNRKLTVTLAIGVIAISLIVGMALGLVFDKTSEDNNDGGSKDSTEDKLILKNDAVDNPDTTWDSEHHSLIDLNGKVEGRVIMIELSIEDEEEQYHFLLLPDLEYKDMVNEENVNNFRGAIMVEIMRGDDFILPRLHIGQHLEVRGPQVTDIRIGHGWNEIDPALVITEI